MSAPVSSQQNNVDNALSFKQALKQVTAVGARKYVYNMHKLGYEAAETIPPLHDRMLVGELCVKLTASCQFYNQTELQQIQPNLAELKRRVEEKRSGNILKRIFIVFLSCMYNWYKGFGFKDSLTLVEEAIKKTEISLKQSAVTDKDVLNVEGQLPFSADEKAFLLELFSPNNLRRISEREVIISARREVQLLINGQKVNIVANDLDNTFKLDRFPDLLFHYTINEPEYWSNKYLFIKEAWRVCVKEKLDRFIIPETALCKFNYAGKEMSVLVHKKLPEATQYISLDPVNEEKQLQGVVEQLTKFLLFTGYTDIVRSTICLRNVLTRIPNKGWYVEFDRFPFQQCFDHGLTRREDNIGSSMGLMSIYPQYAQLIYDTAKTICKAEKWKEIESGLNNGLEQATKILQRKAELENYYQSKNITKETPAIPLDTLDQMNLDAPEKAQAKAIIEDINEVIKKQNAQDLILARQWRFTGDYNSLDSNYNKNIYNNKDLIIKKILPKLKELGYVHYIYNAEEARKYNLDLDKMVNEYDQIVQF